MPESCDAEGNFGAVAAGVRQQLRTLLSERGSGSILRGWRNELDPEFLQRVSLADFLRAASHLGLEQPAAQQFFDECSGIGCLALVDLDHKAAVLATRFKRWAASAGHPRQLFFGEDLTSSSLLSLEDFSSTCRRLGLDATEEELSELFGFCDFAEKGGIEPSDLIFLEPDPEIRKQEALQLKIFQMGKKEQKQRLMAAVFQEEQERKVSDRHRLAPRPWLAADFEHLPKVICERKHGWQMDQQLKTDRARNEFLQFLRKAYGNEVRAWRRGLDLRGTYRVSLNGIRRFCRQEIDLRCEISVVWKALDKDGVGYICLEDVCPKHCLVLADFRQFLHDLVGSCAAVWEHPAVLDACMNPQRDGFWKSTRKLLIGPFTKVLRDIGWTGVSNAESRSLLLSSLDLFACGFVSKADLEWLDGWHPPEWITSTPDPEALQELKDLISNKFSHPLFAWRSVFDKDDSNSVSWQEFKTACQKLRFEGSIGGAWRLLDEDQSGFISLQEFDSASCEILLSFKVWCMEHFGSVELAFKSLDTDGSGSLSLSELKRACRKGKWKGDVNLLFNCLDTDKERSNGKRSISVQEIQFLDTWETAEDEAEGSPFAKDRDSIALGNQLESESAPRGRGRSLKELVPASKEATSKAYLPQVQNSAKVSSAAKLPRTEGSPKASLPDVRGHLKASSPMRMQVPEVVSSKTLLPDVHGPSSVSLPSLHSLPSISKNKHSASAPALPQPGRPQPSRMMTRILHSYAA